MNLIRIGIEDARKLWQMQTEAFQDLYKKYQDTENSPAAENIDKTIMRLQQPFTYYYFIQEFDENVGAVRVVDKGEKDTAKRISPIFVLPQYQRLGIAQKAIRMVGSSAWQFKLGIKYDFTRKGELPSLRKNGLPSDGKNRSYYR